jgi:hypothetical protein
MRFRRPMAVATLRRSASGMLTAKTTPEQWGAIVSASATGRTGGESMTMTSYDGRRRSRRTGILSASSSVGLGAASKLARTSSATLPL